MPSQGPRSPLPYKIDIARFPAISLGDQQPYATRGCSPSELSAGPITPVVIYRFDMGVGRIDTDKQAMCLRCPSR